MEFLIFGTFWFWALSIVAWVLITIAEEMGYYFRATFVLLGFAALYYLFGGDQPVHALVWVIKNPLQILTGVLGYLFVGTGWGVVKWFFFVLKKRDEAEEKVRNRVFPEREKISAPIANDYKEQIITWMVYWPFSMLWTLINDPLRRVFELIYRRIGKLMQSISDSIFKGTIDAQAKMKAETEIEAERRKENRLRGIKGV